MLDDLRFVFWTNEKNIHLMELTLTYFFRYNIHPDIKVTVISNKLPTTPLPFSDKVEYLSSNLEFGERGEHFSKSLQNTLSLIQEKYIFFFCDDYFFVADTQYEQLILLLDMIHGHDIDYFGFDDIAGQEVYDWIPFSDGKFPDGYFYYRDNNYRYLYSVQPSIWKRTALLDLAKTYEFSVHGLDETLIDMKRANKLKCLGKSNNIYANVNYIDTQYNTIDNYFIIAYCEIVRHGVFYHPINGFHLNPTDMGCVLVDTIVHEWQLLNKPQFKKLLHDIC